MYNIQVYNSFSYRHKSGGCMGDNSLDGSGKWGEKRSSQNKRVRLL